MNELYHYEWEGGAVVKHNQHSSLSVHESLESISINPLNFQMRCEHWLVPMNAHMMYQNLMAAQVLFPTGAFPLQNVSKC